MNISPPFAVILGAGKPTRGLLPSALFGITDHGRVLDWLVNTLGQVCGEVVFVGGYQLTEIVAFYPSLNVVVNPNWATSGAVSSLLRAEPRSAQSCVMSYADILYRPALVQQLCERQTDVVIAVDSCWRQRYENRSVADMASAEVISVRDGRLFSAHGRHATERASAPDAEFVGLAKFSARALALLSAWAERPEVTTWDIPQLLNAFHVEGIEIEVVDCKGDWAELNAPQDIARFVLGTKSQTLARLRPMVLQSYIGEQVTFTVGEWRQSKATCMQRVHDIFGVEALVVRSSALGEDGFDASNAGRYDSILNVDGEQAEAIARAVDQVALSYGDDNFAHQILVQRMNKDIWFSGVVMTRTLSYGAPYRVINYDATSGVSDTVTSGCGDMLKTLYIHRDSDILPHGTPTGLQALLVAVREIEGLIGHDSLDIEFIVTANGEVHILQIRPIAVNHEHWRGSDDLVREALVSAQEDFKRLQTPSPFAYGSRALFSVMTDWNPAEIIGIKPRCLAFSLYADLITQEIWAMQRQQYGYRHVAPLPLMHSFVGHPYINIRSSFNSFVPADLDDSLAARLVEYYIEHLIEEPHLHDKIEFEVVFSCLDLNFDRRVQHLYAAGFTVDEVQQLRASLAQLTQRAFGRVDLDRAAINTLAQRRQVLDDAGLPPLRCALMLLDDCRTYGTLTFAHLARSGFVAMTLLNSAVDAGVISDADRASYLQSVSTISADYRDDCGRLQAGVLDMEEFLVRYGHLRPGTYDITVPSYAEDPSRYLDASGPVVPLISGETPEPWSKETRNRFVKALVAAGLECDFAQADHFMRQAIAGREYAKFIFTHSLSRALDQIARFGSEIGLTREELSHLSLADLRACGTGWLCNDLAGSLRKRAEEGRLAHDLTLGVELPPLLLSEDDFLSFLYPDIAPNFIGNASVTAAIVCFEEPVTTPSVLAGKIVLIKQADPGYDWLFAQGIAGLVTAYGGANSHMAVRAAEFGLPAAIGIGERRYHQLASCTRLVLDCSHRTIEILH